MKYVEVLKKLRDDFNPFLNREQETIIDETKNFLVTPARAPYVKNHLLIVPKKNVNVLKELEHREKIEMFELLDKWNTKLHKKHNSVNLLLRDGLVGDKSGKSVNHLHFHLIPDCPIGAENDLKPLERKWLNDDEYKNIIKIIKKDFL